MQTDLERGPLFVLNAVILVSRLCADLNVLLDSRPGQLVHIQDDLPREIQSRREWHEPIEDEA